MGFQSPAGGSGCTGDHGGRMASDLDSARGLETPEGTGTTATVSEGTAATWGKAPYPMHVILSIGKLLIDIIYLPFYFTIR